MTSKPRDCISTGSAAASICARDEIRLSRAELRRDTGRVAGDFLYRPQEETAEFNLTGTGIPLDKIQGLQNPSLPIAGRLDFALRGSGPVRAPPAKAIFTSSI